MKIARSDLTELVTERKKAYAALHTKALEDLGKFCRAKETCVIPGDRDRTLILEGRREVFLRIMNYREKEVHELINEMVIGELDNG